MKDPSIKLLENRQTYRSKASTTMQHYIQESTEMMGSSQLGSSQIPNGPADNYKTKTENIIRKVNKELNRNTLQRVINYTEMGLMSQRHQVEQVLLTTDMV